MVFDCIVGLIIGCGGEIIRDLQECFGCYINIVGELKSVNGFRFVNFIGICEVVMCVKDVIMEIVDSDSRGEVIGFRVGGGWLFMGGWDDV